jgi:hypothetical protein
MIRAALVVAGALGVALGAQARDLLDLTQVTVSSPTESGKVGRGTVSVMGFGSHLVRDQLPIQMRLESMDRNAYREHDEVVFQVSLRNVGREPVTIPWEPDPNQVVTSEGAPMLEWLLVLSLDGAEFDRLTFPVRTLHGSRFSPSTLKVLKPGEQAAIRARGKLHFLTEDSAQRAEATLPRTVDAAARMVFLSGYNAEVVSVNRVPIFLDAR